MTKNQAMCLERNEVVRYWPPAAEDFRHITYYGELRTLNGITEAYTTEGWVPIQHLMGGDPFKEPPRNW